MLTLLQMLKKILSFVVEISLKYSLSWALQCSNQREWEWRVR